MKKTLISLLAACAMVACARQETATRETLESETAPVTETAATTETAALSNATTDFATKAAADGTMEVRLGDIAKGKAQSSVVKDFASMMVADHTRSNDELKAIASTKNVTIPTDLPPEKQQIVDRLSGLSGQEFDREYMAAMVDDHQQAVGMFQQASAAADLDPDLKNFAAKTLPTLEQHLQRAQAIAETLKK